MKKILFTLLFLMAFFAGFTQMNNNGGIIIVDPGATLVIEGNYTSTGAGSIEIDGSVNLKGNFINNGGSVATGSTGLLAFNGTAAQEITGSQSTTFWCAVQVNNGNGVALTNTVTGAHQFLDSTLTLTNGKVTLNAFNLTLSNEGVSGASASKYVVTNSTGQLKAPVINTNYLFPVGSTTSYNPLMLNETGTSDTYGVIFTGSTPVNWTPTDHAVNGNWAVTEAVPTGSDLNVTPQWNGGPPQEQTNFDRYDCAVGITTDNGATVAWGASSSAGGTNPYTQTGTGFTLAGNDKFMVADYFFEGIDLDLDVFLAGPYSGSTMSTALLAANKIPLNDPYGNSTTVASIPSGTVDWIEVQLRDSGTPGNIIKKYSFFVDNNGNVTSTNGTLGTKLTEVAKSQYYVAVKHRNHLGAMTANTIDFTTGSSFAFDFSAGASLNGTNPMRNMGGGIYALWAGDANQDGQVIFQGQSNDPNSISIAVLADVGNPGGQFTWPINNVYSPLDVNMDGSIIFQGGGNDPNDISITVLNHPGNPGGQFTHVVTQQLP